MNTIRMAYRRFRKVAGKAVKYAKKRYMRKGAGYNTGLRLNKLISDVKMIKGALNTEKKSITTVELQNTNIGQCNGDLNTGQAVVDITPLINQGTAYNERTGNSVKLVSMAVKGQFKQQVNCRHPMRIRIVYFKLRGIPESAATIQGNNLLYDVNPITTVTDMQSDRNINYFRQFEVMKTQYVYLPEDTTTGEKMIRNFSFVCKMNHHLKYDLNTNTITEGQLLMAFYADSGNVNASVSSTLNVPITGVSTGATLQYHTKFFYVDN
jgi:hypothetical protein